MKAHKARLRHTGILELVMEVSGQKRQRLSLEGDPDYPRTPISQSLFLQLGTLHLVARLLPSIIDTDVVLDVPFERLLADMYRSEGHRPPRLRYAKDALVLKYRGPGYGLPLELDPTRSLVAYSAGKDSIWNYWRQVGKLGAHNVAIAHIRNLNRSNSAQEMRGTVNQILRLDIKKPFIVSLTNSSLNSGYGTMRSRDLFLTGILVPLAIQFGAQTIVTEGFAEAKPSEPFSGQESTMIRFNAILDRMNIPVQVAWENRSEMDIIRDLYENVPEWMETVQNCFTPGYRWPGVRASWGHRAPHLPLYDSQCGSCVKCRITILGRILDGAPGIADTTRVTDSVRAWLNDTREWAHRHRDDLHDMLEGSVLEGLEKALALYGLDRLKAA